MASWGPIYVRQLPVHFETIHSTTFDGSEASEGASSYPAGADDGDNAFADLSWIDMFCDSFPLEGANEVFAALE